jgi:hypothetical protein
MLMMRLMLQLALVLVALCKNSSAMLFVAQSIQYAQLLTRKNRATDRVLNMV